MNHLNNSYKTIKNQWDPVANNEPFPEDPVKNNHIIGKWKCEKGHFWYETIEDRAHYQKCHICHSSRRATEVYNLLNLRPDIASQLHPTKNKGWTAEELTPHTKKKIWWICKKAHEWDASVYSRSLGYGCPECSNKKVGKENNLAIMRPDLAAEWDYEKNEDLTPFDLVPGSTIIVGWVCNIKQHKWKMRIIDRAIKGRKCPECRLQIPF